MRNRVSKAFTLVEILIVVVILGILAAIVIPQFTNASEEAQSGNVRTQLQTTRSQIELFRVRNNGVSPIIAGAQDASFSDLLCGVNNTFGLADSNSVQIAAGNGQTQEPYMRTAPVNPRNGLNSVVDDATPVATAATLDAVSHAVGWFYDPVTGTFAAAGYDEVPGSATFGQWVPVP